MVRYLLLVSLGGCGSWVFRGRSVPCEGEQIVVLSEPGQSLEVQVSDEVGCWMTLEGDRMPGQSRADTRRIFDGVRRLWVEGTDIDLVVHLDQYYPFHGNIYGIRIWSATRCREGESEQGVLRIEALEDGDRSISLDCPWCAVQGGDGNLNMQSVGVVFATTSFGGLDAPVVGEDGVRAPGLLAQMGVVCP